MTSECSRSTDPPHFPIRSRPVARHPAPSYVPPSCCPLRRPGVFRVATDRERFQRTLVRVMTVQVVTLVLLWLLEVRYRW